MAVLDHVVADLASTTLAVVDAEPPRARDRVRAGVGNIVTFVVEDPRRGQLVFSLDVSNPALLARRTAATRRFASLLLGETQEFFQVEAHPRLAVTTDFLVGGPAGMLAACLAGEHGLDETGVVDTATQPFLAVADAQTPPSR